MKTLILSTCIALLFTATAFPSAVVDKKSRKERREMERAASTFSTSMFISGNKLTVLVFKYGIPKRTTIMLRNKQGNILYEEYIDRDHDKFGRILNIDDLDSGDYSVEVVSNGVTQKKALHIDEAVTKRVLTVAE